jgi:Flp pilus assembly protein TadD
MKILTTVAVCAGLCAVLAGCASAPGAPPAGSYFLDARFAPPREPVDAADVFALNDAMRSYLHDDIGPQLRQDGPLRGLVDALYRPGQLKLDYDAAATRNAAQAFDARRGNCLSLVIMTAAFAKELGLSPTYRWVDAGGTWSRKGDLAFLNDHVNLVLRKRRADDGFSYDSARSLTVDFLPAGEIAGLPTQEIDENRILAMYMNNRAAEALELGDADQAYWWVRGAITQAPDYAAPYNTLGVIYLHHGDFAQAEHVLADLARRNPQDLQALSNLAMSYDRLGRATEAQAVRQRLAALEPYPPYHFFFLGTEAMEHGDYAAARALFAREVARADYNGEFHFWLGIANYRIGDLGEARRQLTIAMENSTSQSEHALYEGKLERLRSYGMH